MNPNLQQILHDITVRITKLEEANALEADPRLYGGASFRYGDHPTSFGLTKRTLYKDAYGYEHEESVRLQCTHCGTVYADGVPPQVPEKQEPVGWIDSKGNMICTKINESCKPLYTTPQQRTWADLTEEEKIKLWDRAEKRQAYQGVPAFMALIQEVGAKLKELNT